MSPLPRKPGRKGSVINVAADPSNDPRLSPIGRTSKLPHHDRHRPAMRVVQSFFSVVKAPALPAPTPIGSVVVTRRVTGTTTLRAALAGRARSRPGHMGQGSRQVRPPQPTRLMSGSRAAFPGQRQRGWSGVSVPSFSCALDELTGSASFKNYARRSWCGVPLLAAGCVRLSPAYGWRCVEACPYPNRRGGQAVVLAGRARSARRRPPP